MRMYFAWIGVRRRTAQLRCTKCGSAGAVSGCMPISVASRLPLRVLQGLHAVTTFVQVLVPPRESGTRWSRVSDSRGRSSMTDRPQYWQR